MLSATIQRLGDATVIHLTGRLVRGEGCSKLRDLASRQTDADTIVLNLAQVNGIDACGIGTLLRLHEWAQSRGTGFKLMNAVDQVHRVLLLTKLDHAFDFCSVREQFCLMHRAGHAAEAAVA
ncbi:MAG: STAS domain-containing protein [Candidatus Korobacteraceae bacterium]